VVLVDRPQEGKGSVLLEQDEKSFEEFVGDARHRLSFALAAAYGPEVGAEATSEALAYAWENWDRLQGMQNPIGYLYRVGQSRAKRFFWKRPPVAPDLPAHSDPWVEPGLPAALGRLTRRQRIAVVLVEGFGWTQLEVAELLGLSRSSVQKHLSRGLAHLRSELKVDAQDD
jgi:DNA-directed RNA polymerase specialized sigma24 family protein